MPNREPYGTINGHPIIEVDRVTSNGSTYQSIIEDCPICGERHTHGFKNGLDPMTANQSKPTHRSPHCSQPPHDIPGYYLIYTTETDGVEFSDKYNGWAAIDAINAVE